MELNTERNTETLLRVVAENPTLPIIAMVDSDVVCEDGSAYCLKCGRAQRERSARCPNCNREMKGEDDAGRKQPPARL